MIKEKEKQYILITGGNSGIGKETAIALAKKGAKIILASRNVAKAEDAVKEIRIVSENEEVHFLQCDLASFDSIRNCVKNYKSQFGQLDILINNAGLIADNLQLTKDGMELQIGVNHLGHFLLTTELIDLLLKSKEARIINVSSGAHFRGRIDFDSFKGEMGESKYSGFRAYAQSKLANVLFTKELARRYPSICSHSLHPGVVNTPIAAKNENGIMWKLMWKLGAPFMITPAKGACTSIYLASSSDVLQTNGRYFAKQKEQKSSDLTNDVELASKLWELSEHIVRNE